MKLGRLSMFNQLRRIWADDGRNDMDFTEQEKRLRDALEHLKDAAMSLSKAAEHLTYVIKTKGLS